MFTVKIISIYLFAQVLGSYISTTHIGHRWNSKQQNNNFIGIATLLYSERGVLEFTSVVSVEYSSLHLQWVGHCNGCVLSLNSNDK